MTKKKLFTLALCLVYMFSAAICVTAEGLEPSVGAPSTPSAGVPSTPAIEYEYELDVTVVDGVAGELKVTGTTPAGEAGKDVTLIVVNNDGDLEDVVFDMETYLQYQNTVVTGEGGRFEKTFALYIPGVDEAVTFNFFAGGEAYDGDIAFGTLWFAPMNVKLAAAKAIVEEADASVAGATIETNKAVFSVESELFEALDKTKLAALLKSKVAADSFEGYVDGNEADYLTAYSAFETALNLSIALEGFNQSKKDLVLTDAGFANDDILGIADYADANGTLAEIYAGDIKTAALTNVTNALFGKGVTTAEELQKLFAKEIIVQALKNNKKNGSGIVADIITEDNLAAAGFDVETEGDDTLKSEYFENSDLDAVNNDIYQNRKSITTENLEEEIIKYAKKDYEPQDPTEDGGVTGPTDSDDQGGFSAGPAPSAKPAAPKFNDIAGYAWAENAINTLAEKNIINGVAEGRFDPAGTLTREQAAKIICLAAGINPVNEGVAFADVNGSAWYAPYIAALNKAGIINGVSDTQFGIGNNVTREDFAVMICRALNYTASKDSSFTDKGEISTYAADAVNALYERGIVGGYEDGSFKPKAKISRAEGAKIIYGILSK